MFIKKKKHPDEDPTLTPEPELVEESRSSKKKKKNNLEDPGDFCGRFQAYL